MDEGSRGQFLNIDRTLINIQEEIEVFFLSDLCQHRTRSPLLKQKGTEFSIPFGFLILIVEGEKTNFSFYMGGSYCEA